MSMVESSDRISLLPDSLIIEILSRLPTTKHAIKTGTLSKRWQNVWTYVPNLVFTNKTDNLLEFFSFIEKTLSQCSHLRKINTLSVSTDFDSRFHFHVNNLIRFAVYRNVEQLTLTFSPREADVELDEFFFDASCVTNMNLSFCEFSPVGAITWNNLKTLTISCAKLDEDLIQSILSGSPCLESLDLSYCYGYRRLDVTSTSVKKLLLCDVSVDKTYFNEHGDVFEINAPNILSLTVEGYLWVPKVLLLDVSSVVEAYFDCMTYGHYETTVEEAQEEMLKSFILKVLHVKTLRIGELCSEAFSGLEAKGIISQLKIENIHVTDHGSKDDEVSGLTELSIHD